MTDMYIGSMGGNTYVVLIKVDDKYRLGHSIDMKWRVWDNRRWEGIESEVLVDVVLR